MTLESYIFFTWDKYNVKDWILSWSACMIQQHYPNEHPTLNSNFGNSYFQAPQTKSQLKIFVDNYKRGLQREEKNDKC